MARVRGLGVLGLLGFLGLVLTGYTGCGGSGGDRESARTSRLSLLITTAAQAPSDQLLRAELPGEPRSVEPGDPAFLTRLDLRVEAADITPPLTQSLALTEKQQQQVTVELVVPVGKNRRITVSAFTEAGRELFRGETTVDLTRNVEVVALTLVRRFLPESATGAAVAKRGFTFADGAVFGISSAVTLAFGSFQGPTGPFTLRSRGGQASGTATLVPSPAAASSNPLRQPTADTVCVLTFTASSYPPGQGPQQDETSALGCTVDEIDGSLRLTKNGVSITSAPPVPVVNAVPEGRIDTPAENVVVAVGEAVPFTATCSDPDATTPLQAAWDFGGGAPNVAVEDPGPVTFSAVGTVTVTLTCSDALGAVDPTPDTRTVTVIGSGIRGLVTARETGVPVAGLSVLAYNFDSGAFSAQTMTDAAGTYLLAVLPGRYKVVALGTGQLATQWSGNAVDFDAAVPVMVGSVTNDVNFVLAPGGAIAGQVTGPDGAPVAGRVVDFFEAMTGRFAATDLTEADGRFARGLAPGRYKVRVNGADSGLATTYFPHAPVLNAATPVEVTLGTITPGVNVQLTQGGRMLGRVTEATTGNPVNAAQILVEDIPQGLVSDATRTEADGTYIVSLAPGRYRVRVRAAGTEMAPQFHNVVGDVAVSRASTPVSITAGTDTAHTDFRLAVGGKITGRVVSAVDSTPLAGVNISALEFGSDGSVNNTSTRFDGTYVLNLPPGDYKLEATATGTNFATLFFGGINERDRSASVRVDAGSTTSNVDFHLPLGGSISGQVTAAGAGLPSVVVLFNDLSTGFLTSVRSQFDGSYRLTLKAPRNYRVYTFTDSTTSPMDLASDFRFPSTAGRAQEVWLTPGMEAAHVDLTLSPDAAVAGRVTAADSTPLPQASVAAVDSATGLFVTSARVDFDGSYRMALPAGNYNIRVEPRGRPLPQQQWFSFDGIPVYSRSAASVVTVATGEEATVNIGVAPGGSISGRLLSLDDGLPVSAAGVALSGQTDATSFEFFGEARVRADGTYTAYGPPGNYRVQAVTSADTPFVREFFNNRPNFWSADLVTITGVDSDTPNIDFVLAPNFDPHGIVVTPDGSRAYVAHRGADSVSVVNLTTRTLAQRIPVGDSPLQMALTPNPHRLFVSNFDGSTISLIDTTTNTTVATILTGPGPDGIVFTSDSARAYVAQNAANDIVVIDTTTNSVVRTIPLGTTSSQIAITPDDQFVYVTTPAIDAVTVISTASNAVVGTIPVGNQPVGIAILPTGGFAYAGNRLESTVSIIDLSTNTVVKTLAVGLLPRRVVSSPDGSVVVTTNEFDHTVSIIETSTNTVVATVPVGRQPWQAAFPPDSRTVFVTNAADNTISVLDPTSRRVIDTIGLGTDRDGDGIADSFERTHGLNPTTAADAVLDPDADGLSNLAEFKAGTNPNNADTDDDGFTDGVEIAAGSHPLNRASTPPFILDQSRLDDPSRRLQ